MGQCKLSENAKQVVESRYFQEGEKTWEELAKRVSSEVAKNENDRDKWAEEYYTIIENMDFIPGGRILRNIGKIKPSTSNCNILAIEDNIESIFETLKNYGIISSFGGGVGINFSPLRPKNAPLKTKGGFSSGVISFIEMFNECGQRLETGGQRRSAGIALLDVSHPDIINFIEAKIDHKKLSQFNISINMTEEFLHAVEDNQDFDLKFAGKIYKTIKAKELWNKILVSMMKHSEPGIVNFDNLLKNNSYYFQRIVAGNPCMEIPGANGTVCNLGAINLVNCVIAKNTNWQKLARLVKDGVRFLDNVIDLAFYPIEGQESVVKDARRIGLGTMGLADYLLKKEIRYGSPRSILEIDRLFRFIRDEAYLASIELACERGAFPKYDKNSFINSSFVRKLPAKIRMLIKEKTIRNVTLLSGQPTGTISLLADVSSGIEPIISKAYRRKDRISERVYIHPLYRQILEEKKSEPEWFVDSFNILPEEHLEVQSVITKYLDNSVSKTIFLPENTSVDELSKWLLEYIYDLKGVTVYVNKSRADQPIVPLSYEDAYQYIKESTQTMAFDDTKCVTGACEV